MEKAMATHSSTLAWKSPWTEEPGRLQSMGSRRVRHDWATSLSLFTFMHWRRKWQPTPVFLNPRDGRAWWAAVYGVAQSRTRLKWLSSILFVYISMSLCVYIYIYLQSENNGNVSEHCWTYHIWIINPKGNQSWIFIGRTDVEAETPILWPPGEFLLLLLLNRFSCVWLCATA